MMSHDFFEMAWTQTFMTAKVGRRFTLRRKQYVLRAHRR
jgi:hypothetical protein